MNYITGEKIQQYADLFITTPELLNYNPSITENHPKALNIYNLNSIIDNPKYIYTCTANLDIFKTKLCYLKNPFVLITHNSDYNIIDNELYNFIANNEKIIKWYSQNVLFNHPKINIIPIGIANSQWPHGNLSYIPNNYEKKNNIYFNFKLDTNIEKRYDCYLKLKDYIQISEQKEPIDYFNYLATFRFAICPEGNGIDTHRLWECFYLKVIPIVIDNIFIRKVKDKYNLPMIILNDWSELIGMELIYNDFDNSILDFKNIMKVVLVCLGVFQEYILTNIKQLKLHGNNNIVLITEKRFFKYIDEKLNIELIDINEYNTEYCKYFNTYLEFDRKFRNEFWYNCSMRFVYIYEYMKKNNITDIIHIENDIMIYDNLDNLKDKFNKDKLYFVFDTINRVVPGIMYINNHINLKKILDNYYMNQNDMINLGKYFNSSFVEPFPIISIINNEEHYFNKNFNTFNSIFDGAALGQYLGGIDKRNDPGDTLGIINETCIITYNNYKFYWKKINNLWNPYIEINNKLVKITNLHIHSKCLDKFLSDNPEENEFISKNI